MTKTLESRPYVFLDVDGVINAYLSELSTDRHKQLWANRQPYPELTANLLDLCQQTNCYLVVIGSMRKTHTRLQFLDFIGTEFNPYLHADYKTGNEGYRGHEIECWWLRNHGDLSCKPRGYPDIPYVVLEDEGQDIYPFQPMVKCAMRVGLQDYDVQRAIELLKLQGWTP